MKLRRIVVAVALFAVGACDGLAPAPAESAVEYRPELAGTVDHAMCLLGFTATPLRPLQTGHQLVAGSLNGKPATFVLDTGANLSVVGASHAQAFGLVPQRGVLAAASGLGGAMKASRSSIDSLELGALKIRQSNIMVADLSQIDAILGRLSGEPVHGIIGQDVMREQRAVIDVARPMLYMHEAGSAPAPVPAERCTRTPAEAGSS